MKDFYSGFSPSNAIFFIFSLSVVRIYFTFAWVKTHNSIIILYMEVIAKQKHQISTKGKDLHWIDGAFTADNLIDAYLKGHRDGCKMVVDLQSIFGLIKRSSAAISDFYNHSLKENGCYSVFMKIQDKTYFIAAIDKDVYFDENKSREIYACAINIMQENPDISISIMPCEDNESINRVSLKADNYIELVN